MLGGLAMVVGKDLTYVSTRGKSGKVNFLDTVMEGLAPDGGLFVPKKVPKIDKVTWGRLQECTSYHQVAFVILSKLAPDMDFMTLWDMVQDTYNADVFSNVDNGDNPEDVIPVRNVGDNTWLLRLANGASLSFKDVALQFVGRLFEYLLKEREETLNILGSTSGDTGRAAIYAMLGRAGVNVFMFSPKNNMSDLQAGHLWSVNEPNIFNLVVDTFDVGQKLVKGVCEDLDFKEAYNIGLVNSINWARIAAQVVYYFWAGLKITGLKGNHFDVAIPSGNLGNACAAHIARLMGLPIRRIILATNENDVLHEFVCTGAYKPRNKMISTISPSMDICMASNLERYIYYLFDGDTEKVRSLWNDLEETGSFHIFNESLRKQYTGFVSMCVGKEQCKNMIQQFYYNTDIVIDPHTATAMHAAKCFRNDNVPCVVAETAKPCLFDETIVGVLGKSAQRPKAFEGVEDKEMFFEEIEPSVEVVKDYIRKHV